MQFPVGKICHEYRAEKNWVMCTRAVLGDQTSVLVKGFVTRDLAEDLLRQATVVLSSVQWFSLVNCISASNYNSAVTACFWHLLRPQSGKISPHTSTGPVTAAKGSYS